VINRDYGGLDALGSKHVAPLATNPTWWTGGRRWMDSFVGIPGGFIYFFTRGNKKRGVFFFNEGKGGYNTAPKKCDMHFLEKCPNVSSLVFSIFGSFRK